MEKADSGVKCLLHFFCRRFSCPEADAERRLLMKCVPLWKKPVWLVVERISRMSFQHDRDAVREALRAVNLRDVAGVVETLHYRGRVNPSFWRNAFRLRLSGRRLQTIASECFRQAGLEPKAESEPATIAKQTGK